MTAIAQQETPSFLDFVALNSDAVPLLPFVAGVCAAMYLWGTFSLLRQGRTWPVMRTLSFVAGCLLLAATTGLGVDAYAQQLFSVFMFQQLTLMMAIPPMLVWGSPGTLLLRATPHHGVGRVILRIAHAGLRARWARVILSPWVTGPMYLLAFYGLYLGGLADDILALAGGYLALQVCFLVAGILFTVPVISADPLPTRMSYGARALDLFSEAALHVFFGVFLMMSGTVFVAHFTETTLALGLDPLADQQLAGGLAWSYGEAPTVIMLVYVMSRWFHDDTARAAAHDRYTDQHGNGELDTYNDYLSRLDRKP